MNAKRRLNVCGVLTETIRTAIERSTAELSILFVFLNKDRAEIFNFTILNVCTGFLEHKPELHPTYIHLLHCVSSHIPTTLAYSSLIPPLKRPF